MERWSAAHAWVDRVAALEARDEIVRREAVEEYLTSQAEDHAEREGRIAEILLTVREEAAKQALAIVTWPLSEQRILQENEDGNEITVIVMPARWSKNRRSGWRGWLQERCRAWPPCARTPMRPTPGGTSPR